MNREVRVEKLRDIPGALDLSQGPEGMNLPGFRLHELKGPLKGRHAVSVSGNWRVTFRFEDGVAVDVGHMDLPPRRRLSNSSAEAVSKFIGMYTISALLAIRYPGP